MLFSRPASAMSSAMRFWRFSMIAPMRGSANFDISA